MSTRDLIDAIYAGDASGIEAAFNQTMSTKVSEKLDTMRSEVAQNMFASESVVEEEHEKDMGTHPGNKKDEAEDEKLIKKMVKKSALNKEEVEELDEKNWIAGAIKHPGAETAAAHKAGESTHEYMEKHKHDSGKAGKRARLGLTLSKISKK